MPTKWLPESFDRIVNLLFYIGFALFLLGGSYYSDSPATPLWLINATYYTRLLAIGLLLLRLLCLIPHYPRYVLGCVILLASFRLTKTLAVDSAAINLFHISLIAMSSRDTDLRVNLKILLSTLSAFLLVIPVTTHFGWFSPVFKEIGSLRGSSLGFVNPNTLSFFIMTIVFLGLYLSKERRGRVILAFCIGAAAFSFLITLNRTQLILLTLLPVSYLIFKKAKPSPLILTLFPLACLFLSIALAFHFGPGYGDTTFESRFSIPALVYDRVGGLKIFGQDCGLTNWFASEPPESLALDNGWLNLFLCDGLLVGGVVMTILSHMFLMIGRTGDPLLCAMACCYAVGGMMEKMVFTSYLDFLPLVYVSLLDKTTPAEKKAAWLVPATALGVVCYVYWPFPPKKASDASYGLVKDIPAPEGFVKAGYPKDSFQEYVRNLPLLAPDTQLEYYDGSPCDSLQYLCHRVVDYPLIDRNEQCADVCMRLWAEYLYRKGSFKKISFVDTRGKTLKYRFGACRQLFDRFLKEVFTWCNTESSRDGNPVKNIAGIEPGDVFVYDAKSRPGSAYGHAVMVASVAVDSLSGRKAVLVLQGSTPACDIHIAGNPDDSLLSPWYIVEPRQEGDPVLRVGNAFFYNEDLRTNN